MAGMPDLGKQIGPLPLGAWIAVVGGSLGYLFYSRSRADNSAPVEVAAGPDYGVGLGGVGAVGAYTPTDGGVYAPAAASLAPVSNTDWGHLVFNYLAGTGVDASTADRAVRQYLDGVALTVQENALITQALTRFGQPPEGLSAAPEAPATSSITPGYYQRAGDRAVYEVSSAGTADWLTESEWTALGSPVPTQISQDNPFWQGLQLIGNGSWDLMPRATAAPAPVTVPAPAPPSPIFVPQPAPAPAPAPARTYVVRPGDSLSLIASRYWEPWITWRSIYNANRGVIGGNPNLIHPGQTLVIA